MQFIKLEGCTGRQFAVLIYFSFSERKDEMTKEGNLEGIWIDGVLLDMIVGISEWYGQFSGGEKKVASFPRITVSQSCNSNS